MSTVLVVGIIILLIICISLVVILLNLNGKNANTNTKFKTNISNNSQNYKKLNISNIKIPKKIEQMDENSLSKAVKIVFDSFKSLDYAKKASSQLDKIEWHTWQVSLLMAILKMNKGFYIPNNNDLFHKIICDINENSVISTTQRVVDKFNNNIDIYKSRDELSQDISWSSKEVSILFYYMSRH